MMVFSVLCAADQLQLCGGDTYMQIDTRCDPQQAVSVVYTSVNAPLTCLARFDDTCLVLGTEAGSIQLVDSRFAVGSLVSEAADPLVASVGYLDFAAELPYCVVSGRGG